MTENKTIVTISFDENGLPQASIEATGEPYERVIEDAKKIVREMIEYADREYEDEEDGEEEDLGIC